MPRVKFKGYRSYTERFFKNPKGTPSWRHLTIEDSLTNADLLKEFDRLYGGTKITISRLHTDDKIMYNQLRKRGLLSQVHARR